MLNLFEMSILLYHFESELYKIELYHFIVDDVIFWMLMKFVCFTV